LPELSRFSGIVIAMYYLDHHPAHFHAIQGGCEVTVEIESDRVNSQFPGRSLVKVLE
jgi:phosphomannomutase